LKNAHSYRLATCSIEQRRWGNQPSPFSIAAVCSLLRAFSKACFGLMGLALLICAGFMNGTPGTVIAKPVVGALDIVSGFGSLEQTGLNLVAFDTASGTGTTPIINTESTKIQWGLDILGDPFGAITLEMDPAYDGDVYVTLVKRMTEIESQPRRAILYVHGFGDYFFQTEMAERFNEQGYEFYAVDLRRYGRSYRPYQTLANTRDLTEYDADLDRALEILRMEGMEWIAIVGHSTGGLTTSLYAQRKGEELQADALILNSPFFGIDSGFVTDQIAIPYISWRARSNPDKLLEMDGPPSVYNRSIHAGEEGEWTFNRSWKPDGTPVTYGWVRAIRDGHKAVERGLDLPDPVLVMHSDSSRTDGGWGDDVFRKDTILDVGLIRERAEAVEAPMVEVVAVEDGMHDLILSPEPVRTTAYETMFQWLDRVAARSSFRINPSPLKPNRRR